MNINSVPVNDKREEVVVRHCCIIKSMKLCSIKEKKRIMSEVLDGQFNIPVKKERRNHN